MKFLKIYDQFKRELDDYYSLNFINLKDKLKRELDQIDAENPGRSPYRRKASIYELAAKECDVKVFHHCPFYYEIIAGRPRKMWGFGGIGEWFKTRDECKIFEEQGARWKESFIESGLLSGSKIDLDFDHHTIGYDHIFQLGLNGIIKKCEERLSTTTEAKQREFLEAVIIGYKALIELSNKFAEEAERMLKDEPDNTARRNMKRISETAKRVPAEPPKTFYEALNTIAFMRETIGSLEGIAVSTYGMMDRMLEPFYTRDLKAGRMTHQEARELLYSFLAITDVKFDVAGYRKGDGGDHVETSTTVIIGGCEQTGKPIYNMITDIILDAYTDLKLVNPKLNARISSSSQKAYLKRLSEFAAKATNVLSVYNDDVLIEASVRQGKDLEDCRLYVGGGCQENLLQNCSTHSRATMWLNLCGVLSATLFPEDFSLLNENHKPRSRDRQEATSSQDVTHGQSNLRQSELTNQDTEGTSGFDGFEVLYQAFLENLRMIASKIAENRSENERNGWILNPCPIHSATLEGCIEKALDWTEGGAKYNDAALDCVGIGSLVDSLYALKTVVYDRCERSIDEFKSVLRNNFAEDENFRRYLINRIPKYGQDNKDLKAFSAMVFKDVAKATSGFDNSRGGKYEASLFAFRQFVWQGRATMATPDGRLAEQSLSPGMSPSSLSLGANASVGRILDALDPIDLKDFPILGILDLKLPGGHKGNQEADATMINSILKRFLTVGGSGLQINIVSPEELKKAIKNPDSYSDLVVRISGYSAYFTQLPEEVQKEVMERTLAS